MLYENEIQSKILDALPNLFYDSLDEQTQINSVLEYYPLFKLGGPDHEDILDAVNLMYKIFGKKIFKDLYPACKIYKKALEDIKNKEVDLDRSIKEYERITGRIYIK